MARWLLIRGSSSTISSSRFGAYSGGGVYGMCTFSKYPKLFELEAPSDLLDSDTVIISLTILSAIALYNLI